MIEQQRTWGQEDWVMPRLSVREREVIALLAEDGASNAEIGRRMFLSEKTVKSHMAAAMQKLGANNRTHLALIVCRQERV